MFHKQCSCRQDKQRGRTTEYYTLDPPLLASTLWKFDLDFIPHLTMGFSVIGGASAARICDGFYCYQWHCMPCNSMEIGHRLFAKKYWKCTGTKFVLYRWSVVDKLTAETKSWVKEKIPNKGKYVKIRVFSNMCHHIATSYTYIWFASHLFYHWCWT